ncbi:MAG: thymidine phosphorylase, partial [Acidobacteriales bacterium]|nr:thymidine phosphorylase [Terriglobales bacterium]
SLTADEIACMVGEYTADRIPDYQMSAWLMAAVLRGLDEQELAALTGAMLRSGSVLDLSDISGTKIDKHSTGGVGDKTSLVVAPAAAAAGLVVPMISGRGLGHTGGTLDKLESIPGFRVNLSAEEIHDQLREICVAMVGQTEDIAPADKRLYALRDVTGTVESPELICASIMSKKLAEGLNGLVLDVKTGSGAFMKSRESARHLAQLMVATGESMGTRTAALVTNMDQPLGNAIGNAVEVQEAMDVLQGRGPQDLTQLCRKLTAWMLLLGGLVRRAIVGEAFFDRVIGDGSAMKKFRELVAAQGGNLEQLPSAQHRHEVLAKHDGFLFQIDCEKIGIACAQLGGGRTRKEDAIDHSVGIIFHRKLGEQVRQNEVLCTLLHNDEARAKDAAEMITAACTIAEHPPSQQPLVFEVISSHG